jgi:hypothetical protein
LEDGVAADGIKRIGHVYCQDHPVWVIATGVNEPLQAHSHQLGGARHRHSALPGLEGPHLLPCLIQVEEAFPDNTAQRFADCDRAHGAVLLPQWDEVGSAEDGACPSWQAMLDAQLGK